MPAPPCSKTMQHSVRCWRTFEGKARSGRESPCTRSTSASSSSTSSAARPSGRWLGSGAQGLKGYFLGESNIPAWAVMISIVATETSAVDVPERAGHRLSGRLDVPPARRWATSWPGSSWRRAPAPVVLPGARSTRPTRSSSAGSAARRRRRRRSCSWSRGRSASGLRLFLAATVLQQITGWTIAAVDRRDRRLDARLHLPRRDQGGGLDRRDPVRHLPPGGRRRAGDPGRRGPRRLGRADRARGAQAAHKFRVFDFSTST